jgi:hypothetical protein
MQARERTNEGTLGRVAWMFMAIALGIGFVGCASVDQRGGNQVAAASGPNPPAWKASYAAREISPGDTWFIYLKASDLDGDMEFVNVWPMYPGRSTTPARLKVERDQAQHLSGYLTLNSMELGNLDQLFHGWIRLRVTLEDRAGHQSDASEFRLDFVNGAKAAGPSPGVFEDMFLGNIPPVLNPMDSSPSFGVDKDRF